MALPITPHVRVRDSFVHDAITLAQPGKDASFVKTVRVGRVTLGVEIEEDR